MKKFIDFIITQNCTYNCSYCSQSKKYVKKKKSATIKIINNFLNFLNTIENDFEITITGGEALLNPYFSYLINEIKNKNFKINLITNFSFEKEKYLEIFSNISDFLNEFAISFHLEQIKNFDKTLEKLAEIIENKPKSTKILFLIPIFDLTLEKEKNIEKIIKIANENKIEYEFQHIRIFNKYQKLSKTEEKYIKNDKKVKSFSKMCFAGRNSAVIYEDGSVYRCYSSRFLKSNYLGNINDKNFKLKNNPSPCLNKFCTCPKPIKYEQLQETCAPIKANIIKSLNFIYLPYLIFKNFDIIQAKLKQKFDFKSYKNQ